MSEDDIPKPDYIEVVEVTCPVDGCDWSEQTSWGDMPLPENYVAHYQEVHGG